MGAQLACFGIQTDASLLHHLDSSKQGMVSSIEQFSGEIYRAYVELIKMQAPAGLERGN